MIKTSGLTARKQGFDRAAFARYLVQVHAPLSRDVTAIAGYVVTAFGEPLPGSDVMASGPDGMAEFWFPNDAARAAMAAEPAAAAWFADSPKFTAAMTSFVETVLAEPADRAALEGKALAAIFMPAEGGDIRVLAEHLAAQQDLAAHGASALTHTTRSAITALDIPPMAGVAWLWADDDQALTRAFTEVRQAVRGPLYALSAVQTLIRNPATSASSRRSRPSPG